MKVTVKRIVISALSTISKIFVQGLEDLEIRGRAETCCHSDSSEKHWREKTFKRVKIVIKHCLRKQDTKFSAILK